VAARRRRAILVGHNGDAGAARDLLTDPAAPVRAAALGALDRIARTNRADGPTTDELAASLADPAPAVRQRALEVLAGPGRPSDPDQPGGSRRDHDDSATRLLAPLLACLGDTDHSVLEVACWAAGELPEIAEATVDALVEVAGPARGQGAHEDALCREAAVAALGALGHERGRAAVLAGLEDRPAIFRRAVLAVEKAGRNAMERAGVDIDDIALVVPHQANIRIIDAALKRLDIPREKAAMVLERTGNTSAASIPLALVDALDNDRVAPGDLVLMVGFGAGMSSAAAVIRWDPPGT